MASADATKRVAVMRDALRESPLYGETVEWLHHSKVENPTKTVLGNYWHDKHQDQLEGAQGAALTDAVIFFMRVAGEAGLGRFTRGTKGSPDSYFKTDASAIAAFVTNKPESVTPEPEAETPAAPPAQAPAQEPPTPPTPVVATTSPAVHVNLEIHIAANATAETVAEVFKNMRKYILSNPDDGDTSS
jgi:hypothetical protein